MALLCASCIRLRWLASRCIDLWDRTQVEYHGRYSGENLITFHEYHSRTSWMRVVCICLFTPLPAILVVILLDRIPMTPPSQGPNDIGLWLHIAFTSGIGTLCLTYQCQSHVSWLQLSPRFLVFVGIVAGVLTAVVCWLIALVIGLPIPFMMIVGTPSVIITVVVAILWSQKEQIRNTPGAFGKMLPYFYVLFCQVAMTMIYPLYNHIFMGLSSMEQTAFVLLLPIIKIACKLWINHSLRDAEDSKPESIIFNVEVFHALFVSYCMQSSTSLRTILVMVLLDLALILISTLGVWSTMNSLQHMIDALGPQGTDIGYVHNLMDVTMSLVRSDPQRYASIKPTQHQLFNKRVGPAALQSVTLGSATCLSQVVPTACTDSSIALTTDRATSRSSIAVKALQLMYLTEFIVLVEYTEFIMPLICSVYVSALLHSSNRDFYQFLEDITAANLTIRLANTSLYMLAELLTLLLISILIWWKLGYSLLHQLAFVLEARQVRVQTKLVLWVLYIVQNAVVHCGE